MTAAGQAHPHVLRQRRRDEGGQVEAYQLEFAHFLASRRQARGAQRGMGLVDGMGAEMEDRGG